MLAWWPPYLERAVQLAVHLRCVGWFEISLVATLLGKSCLNSTCDVLVSLRLAWWPPYWERAVQLAVHLRCVGWFEISLTVVQVAVHLCCVG